MNKHLEPIFKILLPAIEKEEIEYWVYGGIAVAAAIGNYYRLNNDVDIFVKEIDFQKTKSVLSKVCIINHGISSDQVLSSKEQKKFNVSIEGKKRLSVVPVTIDSETIKFKIGKGFQSYPIQILEGVVRNIDSYRFITPSDIFIKSMFKDYLSYRPHRSQYSSTISKIKNDASMLLTKQEYNELIEKNPLWN